MGAGAPEAQGPMGRQSKSPLLCLSAQSQQDLHLSKDQVFEGESLRETLLTASAVVKCDSLAFGAFPGCITGVFTFLPPRSVKVTIYATQCRLLLPFFLLFQARKETWDM